MLGHLGLSPQRPLYKSYQQDPQKIEKYLKEAFPRVVERARELGAEIYFVDEAAARRAMRTVAGHGGKLVRHLWYETVEVVSG